MWLNKIDRIGSMGVQFSTTKFSDMSEIAQVHNNPFIQI